MKKKTLVASVAALFILLAVSLSAAYANHHGGDKACPMTQGFGHGGYGRDGGDLEKMFFWKAHFILENREALELSDDKVQEIKNLKMETVKSLIKQNADIEVTEIDIISKLHDYPVDVTAVDKLLDQKYELKKAKSKGLVDAIAKLKGMLTKEQYDKLRQLWEGGEKAEPAEHK